MKYVFIFLSLFILTSASAQETIYDTIVHDGLQRSYILYVPDSYIPSQETPLVINFHGYTSTAFEQMNYGDFRTIADTAGFLLAHPMGTTDGLGNTYWNANWGGDVDDIGFTEALIDSLTVDYNIDQNRVFSTGMSNGGFMSYTLACELSHRIAAIASVTGTMNTNQPGNCEPEHPMPVMEIHGTADFVVPYNGNAFMESIPNTLAFWANFNLCNEVPEISQIPDIDPNDGCTAELHFYGNGSNGVTVEHFKIINGGHTWPGSAFASGSGNTNQDINASAEIWKFFSKYDINGLINPLNTSRFNPVDFEISVYPNPAHQIVYVETKNAAIDKFVIYDYQGKPQISKHVSSGEKHIQIDTGQLPEGLYILMVYGNQGQELQNIKLAIN